MINRKTSVCLALVHNNNAERNKHVQPFLNQLRNRLQQRFAAIDLAVSIQPEIKPHPVSKALLRDAFYQLLIRQWCRYRLERPPLLPLQATRFLFNGFKKYSSGGKDWRRNSAIEMVVTDKHIRAWFAFLETSADFLLCFEDDVVFKSDSMERIEQLLEALSRRETESSIYVDLAGGLRLEELKIGKLEKARESSFRYYNKPVTNTACAYLLSRPLVSTFHDILIRRPWLRLIGIDWLMNKLFMIMASNGEQCDCMHADPPIFKHGTTTGEYVSWQARV